jgi:zinc finger SWIM domain-containing protein 3
LRSKSRFCVLTGAAVEVLVDESKTLQAIYFQSKEMMETFDGYPELLMVDATYKLNDLRMPLYVLM